MQRKRTLGGGVAGPETKGRLGERCEEGGNWPALDTGAISITKEMC